MELCNSGDMYRRIEFLKKVNGFLKEKTIWLYLIQMICGLKNLHERKIVHRDIKCANLFIDKTANGEVLKLGDMNVSKVAKEGMLLTQTGTPYYASPEVWKDLPYNEKSDIWSAGCVLYEMITLKPPFLAKDM